MVLPWEQEETMRLHSGTKVTFGFVACFGLLAAGRAQAHGGAHMFQEMDTNSDGKVSADEHAAAAKTMFTRMDENSDGKVTAAEMTAGHEKVTGKTDSKDKTAPKGMSAAEKIKVIDTNGDGVLTAEEHAAGAKIMFEKMDANHDGFLTKDELVAGHAKMMSKHSK
jgi:Ca2+-binding EF-hand superfamily protein